MKKWGSLLVAITMLFTIVPTAFGAVRTGWDLKSPRGIATDSSGRIYVTDTGNHRVQVYNRDESLAMTIGESGVPGSDNAHLNTPLAVAVDPSTEEIYVLENYVNRRIQVFSSQGSWLRSLPLGPSPNPAPEAMALDGKGHLFVSDQNYLVYRMNTDGTGYKQIANSPPMTDRPMGIAADSKGNVYITQYFTHTVLVYSYNSAQDTYALTKTLGEKNVPGTDNAHFNKLWGAHVDRSDRLHVVDGGNKRVQVYNSDGSYRMTLTDPTLTNPYQVTTDRDGNVYVSDNYRSILMFDAQGRFVKTLGQNVVPTFDGSQTTLTVAQDSLATDLTTQLSVTDSDSGQTLSWTVTSAPAHGTVSLGLATAASGGSGLAPAGGIRYQPSAGYYGADRFTVAVSDGAGGTASRTIQVTVKRQAAAPTADPASGSVLPDGSVIALSTATAGAAIHATTDGTMPTTASASGTTVAISGAPGETVTVRAIAAGPGLVDSAVADFSYTIAMPMSSNADLQALSLSAGAMNPTFASGTLHYTADVSSDVSSLTVSPSVADAVYATVAVSVYDGAGRLAGGPHVWSGAASSPALPLAEGDNLIEVTVTAQDGSKAVYTVSVRRAAVPTPTPSDKPAEPSAEPTETPKPSETPTPTEEPSPKPTETPRPTPSETPAPTSTPTSGLSMTVNGQPKERLVQTATEQANGQTILVASVDSAKLLAQLAAAGDGAVMVIPAAGEPVDGVSVLLTGDVAQAMGARRAVLDVQAPGGSYALPAAQIDIARLAAELGAGERLSEIALRIQVVPSDAATAELARQAGLRQGFRVAAAPVEFAVTATYGGKTISVDRFSSYVKRGIPLPQGADPAKITTAVVIGKDGTVRHVPTFIEKRGDSHVAIVNSLTNSDYTLIYHPASFGDVAGHWSERAVNDLASRMVVSGADADHYRPDAAVTRAEFAAILVRALGLGPSSAASPFADIDPAAWHAGSVTAAAAYGLVQGDGQGSFGPSRSVTREEALTMLARAMTLAGLDAAGSPAGPDSLAAHRDGGQVSAWAQDAFAAALRHGLVQGSDKGLEPKRPITRAETAALAQRLLVAAGLIDQAGSR
ncbi:hypothetical protein HGI30_07045 [Paenibacillus albicereus]|uniref:SLH domain-containing protein n=1 Tax=Paenibacillus albicereus TaxID=2726185 RepID=A0A6H2GVA4_9BACL|nr:S-layer homology domain-containing protein [Paenibacillus albicereus]QJC51325.1 hypothetical protein HGI30_07045 [Paenibacillus albicereus]